jgi:hypothetical protein
MKASLIAFCVVLGSVVTVAVQVRDNVPTTAPVGSNVVTGVVADATGRPLRSVLVRLEGAAPASRRVVVTAADGRFTFRDLPSDRYGISANKAAYLAAHYGATSPGRPGTSLVLAAGQTAEITLTLFKAAVISGLILNPSGEPSVGTPVQLYRWTFGQSGPAFQPVSGARTDDRGEYRAFGLLPGDYLVAAVPATDTRDIRMTTQADLDAVQREARGDGLTAAPARVAVAAGAVPPTTQAPIYFPGTADLASASIVTVTAGSERGGVDIQTQIVATSRVAGTVTSADRVVPAGAVVLLVPTSYGQVLSARPKDVPVSREGTFVFDGVAPGQYILAASAGGNISVSNGRATHKFMVPTQARSSAEVPIFFGTTTVNVQGSDESGLSIALAPGTSLSGQLTFSGAPRVPDGVTLSVVLVAAEDIPQVVQTPFSVRPDPTTGRFVIPGVTPGKYRVSVVAPLMGAVDRSAWHVRSITMGGRDVADLGIEVAAGVPIPDAVVAMSDRGSELRGSFLDASGRPTSEYFVVLFPADPALWAWSSRRIVAMRPGSDGEFAFRNLPPGEYLLGATTDVAQDEWFDRAFLQRLVPAAIRVPLGEDERRAQNIALPK